MNKLLKIFSVAGVIAVFLLLSAVAASAAVVDVASSTGVQDDLGAWLLGNGITGDLVQIIKANGTIHPPSSTDGSPTGGDVLITTCVIGTGFPFNPDEGKFVKSVTVNPGDIIYFRCWNGSDFGSSTYYGDSSPYTVTGSASQTFDEPTFGTDDPKPTPAPTITRTPTTITININEGDSAGDETFDVGNSGSADLNYTITENPDVAWITGISPGSSTITSIGADQTQTVSFSTAALTAAGSPYPGTIRIADSAATNSPQNVTVTVNVTAPGVLTITTTSLLGGTVSTAYDQTVAATNGTTPYTWSITAGALPTGLALNTSTGQISGTPTGAETANFTVQVEDDVAATDTQALSIVIAGGSTDDFSIDLSVGAHIGQTIVITGTGFGATKSTTAITVDGVTANPTTWSDTEITLAVPDGVATGSVTVTVGAQTASLTVLTGGIVIDDVEGGSVGVWGSTDGLADSGYYAYDEGVTPDTTTITNDGPQTSASKHGARGMRVAYDGSTVTGYGGGWGAALANPLDISGYSTVSFFINWDGSANDFKFALKDSAGHSWYASVSNVTLNALGSYGQIVLNQTAFADDVDDGTRIEGPLDWTDIVSYNLTYITMNASGAYQYIDSIGAGDVDWGDPIDPDPEPSEVIVTEVQPDRGPAGTQFTAIGSGFGISQGQSIMVFENLTSGITYNVDILSWSDTAIEAIVPRLAPTGSYELKVIKLSISAGSMRAYESNPEGFLVTGIMPTGGTAVIFPNPFNPLATELAASGMTANQATIAYVADGVQNIGIYVYDSTARLVYHAVTTDTQVAWDGRNTGGNVVADGIYLLRVVNEDTKNLIAKGKILVIKSH
jgi:hypothetical protein